jgi:hypothetical protein
MNRRDFLRSAGAASASFALARASTPGGWRTFEVRTRVEILKASGPTRVWLPAPLIRGTPFQKTLSNKFSAEGGTARIIESTVAAEFPAGTKPVLTLTSRIATKELRGGSLRSGQRPDREPR